MSLNNQLKITSIAGQLMGLINPFCDQLSVCGDIRLGKKFIKNIVIVAVVFNEFMLQKTLHEQGDVKDYGKKLIKYEYKGISTYIYLANVDNYGYIKLWRTGNINFNKAIITKLKRNQVYAEKGFLYHNNGSLIQVNSERQVFELINKLYINPMFRNFNHKQSIL